MFTPLDWIQFLKNNGNDHYPRYHADIGGGQLDEEKNILIPLAKLVGEQKHVFQLMGMN